MPAPDRRRVCIGALALLTATRAVAAFGFDELMTLLSQRKSGGRASRRNAPSPASTNRCATPAR